VSRPRRSAAGRAATAIALVALSCAPTYAEGYEQALAAGLRAQNAGRWAEAARHFDEAARLGARYKDRDEARLLYAEALEKDGRLTEAEAAYRKVERESGGRYQGVRAAFALGRLVWETRGFEAGEKELTAAVRKYPSSGLVRHAVRRMLQQVEDERGAQAALAWLEPLRKDLAATAAAEAVTYEHGTLLARCGRKEEAVSALLKNARTHKYPQGSLTDDGFYMASIYLEELGRPREAIDVLEEMLRPMESAYAGASYERPRFPQAAYRIALLWRDGLGDKERAKKEFWRVYRDHGASRFVDDALWQKARLEHEGGQAEAACKTLETLAEARADSRYVRCAHLLCASIPRRDEECAPYVIEALKEEKGDPLGPGDGPFAK
jgi:tetratricopeptide (TPR) repeat protein